MSHLVPGGPGTDQEPIKSLLIHSWYLCLETYSYGQKQVHYSWVCTELAQIHGAQHFHNILNGVFIHFKSFCSSNVSLPMVTCNPEDK